MPTAGATGYREDGLASADEEIHASARTGREGLRLLARGDRNGAMPRSRGHGRREQLMVAVLNALTRFLEARPRSRAVQIAMAVSAVGVAYGLTVLVRAWTPHTVAFSPGSGRGAEFIVTLPGAVCTQAV